MGWTLHAHWKAPTLPVLLLSHKDGTSAWRHDSILKKILLFLRQHLTRELYGNLNGFRATENQPSTVPPNLLPTLDRPDIVFVREDRKIIIIELISL